MKSNGVLCLILFIVIAIIPNISLSERVTDDLKPTDYQKINQALIRADEIALPRCQNDNCRADMVHLLRAATLRIQWKLEESLREARLCEKLSGKNDDITHYACARLIHSDATNLFGYRGYWSTIGVLADALKRGYTDQVWGHSSSVSSNQTIMEADRLKKELIKYHFGEKTIEYDDAITSVPLVGSGSQKTYSYNINNQKAIRAIINYPSVHVNVNGENLVMLIDTGSAVTTLYESSAKRLGVKSIDLDHGYARGVTGVNIKTKIGVLRSLKFANMTLKNTIVDIVRRDSYAAGDGIIGLDLISKIHSLIFTKTKLLIGPVEKYNCDTTFKMSSDLYAGVNGIVAAGSDFDVEPIIAVLDTGNAAAAISPTWGLVKRYNVPVADRSRDVLGTFGGSRSFESGTIKGSVNYIGIKHYGEMRIGSAYPDGLIDINIGMPYFYGKNLYINFHDMKICMFR